MMKKVYPRTGDTQTVYLNAVVKDPSIKVGDYTIYNDFVSDPLLFERNNVLYHYPVNHERLIIGKFCSIACGAKFLFNCANHTLKSLSTYTFTPFYDDWNLEKSDVSTAWDNKGDIVIGNDVWIGYEAVIMAGSHRQWGNHSRPCCCYERRAALYDSGRCSCPTDKAAFR